MAATTEVEIMRLWCLTVFYFNLVIHQSLTALEFWLIVSQGLVIADADDIKGLNFEPTFVLNLTTQFLYQT